MVGVSGKLGAYVGERYGVRECADCRWEARAQPLLMDMKGDDEGGVPTQPMEVPPDGDSHTQLLQEEEMRMAPVEGNSPINTRDPDIEAKMFPCEYGGQYQENPQNLSQHERNMIHLKHVDKRYTRKVEKHLPQAARRAIQHHLPSITHEHTKRVFQEVLPYSRQCTRPRASKAHNE